MTTKELTTMEDGKTRRDADENVVEMLGLMGFWMLWLVAQERQSDSWSTAGAQKPHSPLPLQLKILDGETGAGFSEGYLEFFPAAVDAMVSRIAGAALSANGRGLLR